MVAVIISLVVNQLLALVVIGFLPFLILPGLLQFCILSTHTAHYKRLNNQAEKVGPQKYISSIRRLSFLETRFND